MKVFNDTASNSGLFLLVFVSLEGGVSVAEAGGAVSVSRLCAFWDAAELHAKESAHFKNALCFTPELDGKVSAPCQKISGLERVSCENA